MNNENFLVVKDHINRYGSRAGRISVAGILKSKDAILGMMMEQSGTHSSWDIVKVSDVEELEDIIGNEGTCRIMCTDELDYAEELDFDIYVVFNSPQGGYDVYTVFAINNFDYFGVSRININLGEFEECEVEESVEEVA